MRRLLLAFLLVFLPLQSVWAAALPYCSHEASPQAGHFGHHAHEHHAGAAPLEQASSQDPAPLHPLLSSSAGTDMDCHACHGMGNAVFTHAGGPALRLESVRPATSAEPALTAPPPHRPERPNWPALA